MIDHGDIDWDNVPLTVDVKPKAQKMQTLDEMFAENPEGFVNPTRTKEQEEAFSKAHEAREALRTAQSIEAERPEYCEGYEAQNDGESINSNPYVHGSNAYYEWQAGWIEAEEDGEE